jgi:hypothetical protein
MKVREIREESAWRGAEIPKDSMGSYLARDRTKFENVGPGTWKIRVHVERAKDLTHLLD